MSSWRETFLSLPIDARRRYAELYCGKGIQAKVGTLPPFPPSVMPKHSKQEMLDFAKRHHVVTKDEMYTAIHDFRNENPPTMSQIEYMFGSYSEFRKELENDPKCWRWSHRIGDEELARYCAMLKIKNSEHYCQLRKTTLGEVLPPYCELERRFGSWILFQTLMISYSVDIHMDCYFRESIKAGRPLTITECDQKGIEIRYLKQVMTPALFEKVMHEKEELFRKHNPDSYLKKDQK